MKIVHIVPGSGGPFYCQNCLRDTALAKRLIADGHDVVIVPMYLPLSSDEPGLVASGPVFFGAISLYLRQIFGLRRSLPRFAQRLLDSRPMLQLAARRAGSTRAAGLEEMTLSMLRGEDGNQAADLERLIDWLRHSERPDVIQISNALLLGLARPLRQAVGAPIVCLLQDEDKWVEAMGDTAAARIWSLMSERAADVDALVAVSHYYADTMRRRLAFGPEKMHVVPVGIDTEDYLPAEPDDARPALGYLSRLSQGLGLGALVDAFIQLKKEPDLGHLVLRVMGGSSGDDTRFLRRLRRRLRRHGLEGDVELVDEHDRQRRISFLRSLSVLSVPVLGGEAFGTFILEALAAGVPVVQPRQGAFEELVEATGGGVLYEPDDPSALAEALASLLRDPQRARELGDRGREVVNRDYTISRMARDMAHLYSDLRRQRSQAATGSSTLPPSRTGTGTSTG